MDSRCYYSVIMSALGELLPRKTEATGSCMTSSLSSNIFH